jgi:phosphatidylinositol glycan class B
MIYSKKELYNLLTDIENKVNENIRRNVQENLENESIRINSQESIANENLRRNIQDNKKYENIKRNKKENKKYKSTEKELLINTKYDYIDETKANLTHPYSFSKEKSESECEGGMQNNRNKILLSNKQLETQKFQNSSYINKNNNNINNFRDRNIEQSQINFNENNKLNIFSNLHKRNTYSSNKNKSNISEIHSKNDIDLSSLNDKNPIKKYKNNIHKNKNKNKIQTEKIKPQQKLKEFYFETRIFLMLVLFRFINSISIKTFFVPDEYWQSVEVAHNYVFDYGYLTWEWKKKIRSFSYPFLFTLPYMILKYFNLDNTDLLIYFPRIVQVFIAALCDLYTYKLTKKYFGRNAAKWALICSMLSWSNWNILVRTISNSIETSLTVMALYYWPLKKPKNNSVPISDLMIALALAAIACFFRPTNGIIWIFLGITILFQYRKSLKALINIVYGVLIIFVITLIIIIGIDKFYFNEWVISPWNFVKFNIIEKISVFYGYNSWHWYFSVGLPFIGYTFLVFMIPGVIMSKFNILFYLLLWTVGVYSNFVHKEYRFIYPIVPIIFFYSGHCLDLISKYDKKIKSFIWKNIWKSMALLVITNIPLAYYITIVHQRGVMDATIYLRKEIHQHENADGILFLMPCHSTPFYSYIHKNITLDFLTCEPPIGEKNIKSYKSEEDFFYEDPKYFLFNHYSHNIGNTTITYPTDGKYETLLEMPRKNWPNYIVFFNNIYDDIKYIFENSNYKEVKRYYNSDFNTPKRRGNIIIYSNIDSIENN